MTTTLTELADSFFARINTHLAPLGFKGTKGDQAFRVRTKSGTGVAHYALVRHPGVDFEVMLDFGLRIDAVEALTNDVLPSLSGTERRKLVTLGVGYGNLVQGNSISWAIGCAEDVDLAVEEFTMAVVAMGLPFFERYADIREAMVALGGNEPIHWLLSPLHDKRASRSTIMAYLLRDKGAFDMLAKEHEDNLVSRKHIGLERFRELVAGLRERW